MAKNPKAIAFGFFHLCPQDTTSFARLHRVTSFVGKAHNITVRLRTQMNDVADKSANEVLRNEVLASLEMKMPRLRKTQAGK